jgi:anti-sigma-K factor RskA
VSAPDAPLGAAPAEGADDPRHPELALAPDHALGLLEPAERAAYEAHLAGCAECRAETSAYGETMALLARALPAAAPPARLRARILDEARAAGRGAPADAAAAGAVVPPAAVAPAALRVVRADPPAAPAPPDARRPDAVPLRPAARGGARLPWLAAAASLALAAGLGAGWAGERAERARSVAAAESRLRAELAARPAAPDPAVLAQLAARDSAVASLDSLVRALTEDGVQTARLVAAGEPEAMRLVWNRRRGVVVVTAARLAAPDPGRVYQLWGIASGGRPQSLGVFRPGADGALRTVLAVPPGAAMDVAAVTVEPAGGSDAPTGAPVMTGEIGAE